MNQQISGIFRFVVPAAIALVCLLSLPANAAPVFGEKFDLRQPDGTFVPVLIWGDEHYQVVESVDGYTLVRDPLTQVICYATLSPDETELLSTGLRVYSVTNDVPPVEAHLRIKPEAAQAQALEARKKYILGEAPSGPSAGIELVTPPKTGDVEGLCLIVDFPDEAATIAASEINDYCNEVGYTGFGNNGSIYDYFHAVSNGALRYTNYVPTVYYTAANIKSYYDNPAEATGPKARELMAEALDWLEADGYDFSQNDANGDGYIDAVNCFYAGVTSSGWAKGLWPHAGYMTWSADGVTTFRYQVTGMGASPSIGTFCHENGHMLLQWPDLYDYGYDSRGVGYFCIMCNNGSTNPQHPCAYLKLKAGWATATLLSTPQAGLSVTAESNVFFKLPHPSLANEYYLVSNRQATGRDSILPDSGLAIWHIDENGDNDNQEMTPASHYEVTLVQADGNWDLENNIGYGDANDFFDAASKDECGPLTSPHSNWWAGNESTFDVHSISANGTTMTFDFGAPASSGLRVTSGEDFDISGPEGGPFAPASKVYRLANTNASAINWSAGAGDTWLDFSSASGTLSAGTSVDITVTVNANANALLAGDHVDTITFSDDTNTVDYTRTATLTAYTAAGMTWDTIASPQALNSAFATTLSAVDGTGTVVTTYAGNATLSALKIAASLQVGTSTGSRNTPLKTTSHDCRMESIYLASEIGTSGDIQSLAIYVSTAPGQTLMNWTIRLQHTTQDVFPPYGLHSSGWTTCYQDDIDLIAGDWNTFVFSTPFAYNGTDNLLVDFSFNNSSSSTDGASYYSVLSGTSVRRSQYQYFDSTEGDPLTWSGYPGGTIYLSSTTPNVLLDFGESVVISPTSASFTNGVSNNNVSVLQPGTDIRLVAKNASMLPAVSNSFIVEGPEVLNVTSSHADGAFKAGEVIDIDVVFSDDVLVTGTPQLTLETGGTDRVIDYTSGSTTDTLTFSFTVQAGDVSSDLDYTATTSLSVNGGTIRDDATNSVDSALTLPAPGAAGSLGANKNIAIDTAAPSVIVSTTAADPTNSSPIPVDVDFSESVIGFISTDVSVTNGTVSNFGGGAGAYSFDVTPGGQGTVTVSVPVDCSQDNAGNGNTASNELTLDYDSIAPMATLSSTAPDPTDTSPIPVDVAFTENVLGFEESDLQLTNATVANFSGGGDTWSFDLVPAAQGTASVTIPAACATDTAGNNTSGDTLSRLYSVAPSVSISAPSLTHANGDDVSYTITYTGATAVTLDAGDVTVQNTGTATHTGVTVTGSGTTERTVTLPGTSGDGTLGISLASGTADNGLGADAPAAGPSATFVVDTTAPAIVIDEPSRWFVHTGHQLTFDLYFLEADAISLDNGDVTLVATGTADGDVFITGTGTFQRKVRILNLTGNGTLAIGLAAGVGADSAGNVTPAITTGPVATVDNTPPAVYVGAPSISSTTTGPVSFNVLFSGAYGVLLDAADVTKDITGTADGAVAITGAGRYRRKINLSATTGEGSLGVSLLAGTAYDRADNFAIAAGPSPTFRVDNSPPFDDGSPVPQISISPPTRWYTGTSQIAKFTVAYTDADIITLASGDLVLNTTGSAAADVTVTGTGKSFRKVNLYNLAGEGSISFNILSGTASNVNGTAPAAGPGPVVEVDDTAPGVYISPPSELRTSTGPVTYTVLFSDAYYVTLSAGDVTLVPTGDANGTISVSGAGRYKRKVRISGITGNGTLSINLGAGTCTDWAGNPALAAAADVPVKVSN